MTHIGPHKPFTGVSLGSPEFWDGLNEVAEWAWRVKTMDIGPGLGGSEIGPHGISLAVEPSLFTSASEFGWFRVKNVANDWLECVQIDSAVAWSATLDSETPDADLILVSKPWWLRVSTWNGVTYPLRTGTLATYTNESASDTTGQTRTAELADDDETTETQVVTPAWRPEQVIDGTRYAGSLILAANKRLPGATDGDTTPINWTDITPRQWARQNASEH